MATAAQVLGVASGAYSGLVGLFGPPSRRLGDLVADAVLEEVHEDELTLTDHPVQTGSTITDHAFKLPSKVTLTYGWSQSPSGLASARETLTSTVSAVQSATTLQGRVQALYGTARINDYYARLLALQTERTVFSIVTGRRRYDNMMLISLSAVTDRDTENAIIVRATCREIQFADTSSMAYGGVVRVGTVYPAAVPGNVNIDTGEVVQ